MFRLTAKRLLLQLGLTALWVPSLAMGQIFARAALEIEDTGNAACGLSSCPPHALTYGYYHEHWRRWPEEPATSLTADTLSPFAKPDRRVPRVELPEPRLEDSMAPQRPPASAGAGAGAARAGQPTQTTPRPTPQARPLPPQQSERPDTFPEIMPSDLPSQQPSSPSDQGGFFPSPDESGTDPLPGGFPEQPLDNTLPPLDLNNGPPAPADPFNAEPPQDNADDVFDLDDFGQVNPQRLHRYGMNSTGQMRQPGSTRPLPTPRAAMARQAPVQLAAYRNAGSGRRNPLRASNANLNDSLQAVPAHPSSWATEPIAAEPVQQPEPPLEWNPPAESPRRMPGRANPLR